MNTKRTLAWCSFALLYAWLSFVPTQALDAAQLHAILVADTLDATIGEDVKVDLKKMQSAVKEIAKQTDLTLDPIIVTGRETSPSKLLARLDSVTIDADDVVVFFYSGHGYRTPSKGKSPWPNLAFSQSENGVDYAFVAQKLLDRSPRFLLAIADVCNSVIPDELAPTLVRKMIPKPVSLDKIRENYRNLFLYSSGAIVVASSEPGEYSWATPNGSLYTLAFLQELSTEVHTVGTANWLDLLGRVTVDLEQDQHPVYYINVF